MSKYLTQQNADMEGQRKRRDEMESRRQFDLLGVEDPHERAEIKRAHHDERVNERLADQRADRAITQAEERAPKRRKGRPPHKPLTGKEWLEVIKDPRNDKDDRVFWTDLANATDSDCNSEERKEINEALSSLPQTQRPRMGLRSILATGEKDEEFRTVTKSQRKARISLVEKNKKIAAEIKILETRRAARWNELVESNAWANYEEDPEVIALDRVIEEKSRGKVKVWTALRDRNRRIEAGLESEPEESSSDSSSESSSDSEGKKPVKIEATNPPKIHSTGREGPTHEELESLFLIQIKKGDHHLSVKFVRNNVETDWEGPFDLQTSVGELLSYGKMVQPQESSTSVDAVTAARKLWKEVRANKAPGKVGLAEIFESERKRLEKESTSAVRFQVNDSLKPKFEMGQRVYYFINEVGNEKWHSSRVIAYSYPRKWGSSSENTSPAENEIKYRLLPDRENGQEYDVVYRNESKLRR